MMLLPKNFGVTIAPGRGAIEIRHAAFYELGLSKSDRVAWQAIRLDLATGPGAAPKWVQVCLAKTPSLLHDKDLCRLRLGTLSS